MTAGTVTRGLDLAPKTTPHIGSADFETLSRPVKSLPDRHTDTDPYTAPNHHLTTPATTAATATRRPSPHPARTRDLRRATRLAVILTALVWVGPPAAWFAVTGAVYVLAQHPGLLVLTLVCAALAWYSTEGDNRC